MYELAITLFAIAASFGLLAWIAKKTCRNNSEGPDIILAIAVIVMCLFLIVRCVGPAEGYERNQMKELAEWGMSEEASKYVELTRKPGSMAGGFTSLRVVEYVSPVSVYTVHRMTIWHGTSGQIKEVVFQPIYISPASTSDPMLSLYIKIMWNYFDSDMNGTCDLCKRQLFISDGDSFLLFDYPDEYLNLDWGLPSEEECQSTYERELDIWMALKEGNNEKYKIIAIGRDRPVLPE